MPMSDVSKLVRAIRNRDDFLLVGHSIPDGDCIGSLIGMYLGLTGLGKKVKVLLQDPVPAIYRYLEGSQAILSPDDLTEGFEQVIFLDCSDPDRAGSVAERIVRDCRYKFNIDHHHSNTRFARWNYVDDQASSTSEMVLEVLLKLKAEISYDIANALYIGILQDTGGFQHNSTSGSTFRALAYLRENGADLDKIKHHLFESKSRAELKLLCLALQNMNFSASGKIAWMILNYDEVNAIGAIDICPEGIINHALNVKEVEVALMFREISPGEIKVGFRSKGAIDVAAIAAEFGGGGHRRASGCRHAGPMEDAEREVVLAVEGVME